VSRLVPDNSLDIMLAAFRRTRTTRRLVVVGGANYHDAFHDRLRALVAHDARIRLVGTIHDQALLKELWCNSYAYLHGHSVGGTNPSLLRAMGYGTCVIALDTVFNREVLGDAGLFFPRDVETLALLVDGVDANPSLADAYRARGPERVGACYSWDRITDQYEQLLQAVADSQSRSDDVLRPPRATRRAAHSRAPAGHDPESPPR
jgi:glycosyltransferase involved in cell wall biosynthesis